MLNIILSALRVKNVRNTTRIGLVNSFLQFLKTIQNILFYVTLIALYFLENKIYKFYHILQAKCNNSKVFQ